MRGPFATGPPAWFSIASRRVIILSADDSGSAYNLSNRSIIIMPDSRMNRLLGLLFPNGGNKKVGVNPILFNAY